VVGIALAACGSSTSNTPAPPAIGDLIDRMGRPAVNTAVTDPFDTDKEKQDTAKDKYNTTGPEGWVSSYKSTFAGNIAIYDALDTVCGNQFAAGKTAAAGRYDALAGVLA